jgi:hypothetical protein
MHMRDATWRGPEARERGDPGQDGRNRRVSRSLPGKSWSER